MVEKMVGVYELANNMPSMRPEVDQYLRTVIGNSHPMQTEDVHESFDRCKHFFEERKGVGLFYDYLTRREIYLEQGEQPIDARAERYCLKVLQFESGLNESEPIELNVPVTKENSISTDMKRRIESYRQYKDPSKPSLDIIEHIFNTCNFHQLYSGENVTTYRDDLLNLENIKVVIDFVRDRLMRRGEKVICNPDMTCQFFKGDADLLFEKSIMEVKTSVNTITQGDSNFLPAFYQCILYALGYYVRSKEEKKKLFHFEAYNPLRGKLYKLHLPTLDYDHLIKLFLAHYSK